MVDLILSNVRVGAVHVEWSTLVYLRLDSNQARAVRVEWSTLVYQRLDFS